MAPPTKLKNHSKLTVKRLNGGIFQYFICFNLPKSPLKPRTFRKNQDNCNKNNNSIQNTTDLPLLSQTKKTVKFNSQPEIHVMHVWDFAYRQARKDIWQQNGRDRVRFEKRINDFSEIITPILIKHKCK